MQGRTRDIQGACVRGGLLSQTRYLSYLAYESLAYGFEEEEEGEDILLAPGVCHLHRPASGGAGGNAEGSEAEENGGRWELGLGRAGPQVGDALVAGSGE